MRKTEPGRQAAVQPASQKFIRPDMTVRQVACDFPACRDVFVKYGEPAQREPFGHLEPLDRFAHRHGVSLDQLLRELSEAAGVPIDRRGPAADRVHRPFLATSLVITLTIGAGWGAWLLWRIGLSGQFDVASVAHVVAHGDAQLWGFIGMFVAGIALRWLPAATATRPASRLMAASILACLVVGVVTGFVWALRPGMAPCLGGMSGAAQSVAVGLFAWFVFRRVMDRLSGLWARAVSVAAVWWLIWAGFTFWLRGAHGSGGPGDYTIAERNWNIELAVFAVAGNAIYGFGLRLLPGILGGSVKQHRASWGIGLHNVGLILFPIGHFGRQPIIELLAVLGVATGAVVYATALPGLRRPKRFSDRPEQGAPGLARYVQLAMFWLVAGVSLLLVGQAYAVATGQTVPHAWRGAARHALTVGFLTTLIMGVAQRILPVLGQTLLAWPGLVMPILALIAVGNAVRVISELATLIWPTAFIVMPFSALLELAALTLFAANCLRTMWPRPDPVEIFGQVTANSSVATMLAEHPWLEDELIADGIGYLKRTRGVPRELTIASMCRSERRNPQQLVQTINHLLTRHFADQTQRG